MITAAVCCGSPAMPAEYSSQSRRAVSMSPTDKLIAVADAESGVAIISLEHDRLEKRLEADVCAPEGTGPRPLAVLSWSGTGRLIAGLHHGGQVEIWDLESGKSKRVIAPGEIGSASGVTHGSLAWIGDDALIIGKDNSALYVAQIWTTDSVYKVTPHGSTIAAFKVSGKGDLLAVGDERGDVKLWPIDQAGSPSLIGGRGKKVLSLAFSPDGKTLAIADEECSFRLVAIANGNSERRPSHCDAELLGGLIVDHVCFSPDGKMMVSSSSPFWEARAWDALSGEELWRYDYGGGNPGYLTATFSSDGQLVALALRGVVLDARTGTVVGELVPDGGMRTWIQCSGNAAWRFEKDNLEVFEIGPKPGRRLSWTVAKVDSEKVLP